MVHKCTYNGKKEKCVGKGNSYPITKNGKINLGRIRNALARGAQQHVVRTLKKNGICPIVERLGIHSKICG